MHAGHNQPVLQDHRKMVAFAETLRREPVDDPANFGVPFAIGEPPLAVDDGDRSWAAFDCGDKAAAEIKHGSLYVGPLARPSSVITLAGVSGNATSETP